MSYEIARKGFTLIELVVSLVLFGIATGAIYSVLRNNQLAYQRQIAQVDMNNTVRTTLHVLRNDLLDLNAGDTLGSDIVAMGPDSLVYKATRSLWFLCQPPTANSIILFYGDSLRFPRFGWSLSQTLDTLMVYAENDPSTVSDDEWRRLDINGAVAFGNLCPGGEASYTVTVGGGVLGGVENGAPVRVTQNWKLKTYADALGDWWLGAQQLYNSGSVSALQPVVGPINGASGLSIVYYDSTGATTTTPAEVKRVAISVTGRSDGRVVTLSGLGYATEALTTGVKLRNNPIN